MQALRTANLLLLVTVQMTAESAAAMQATAECLQLDRGVKQLQGCGVDADLLLRFPTKKEKEEKKTLAIIHQSFFSFLGKGGKHIVH